MNKMLISARNSRETRAALTHDGRLYDFDIENVHSVQRKANIYKGIVTRVETSLAAVFVDYGAERHGFLPFKEVASSCFAEQDNVADNNNDNGYVSAENTETSDQAETTANSTRFNVKDAVYVGQELLVQVEKEERGNKGAALTTFISLAGSYLVLMPNNPKVGGISRQIEGEDRDDLKEKLRQLAVPAGMGVIIRTAGVGKSQEDLAWDLEILLKRWHAIEQVIERTHGPLLVHREDDMAIRAIRDYLRYGLDEIIVDTEPLYQRVGNYIETVCPELLPKLHLWRNKTALFSHYRLEKQIDNIYQRVVKLPSGGSISIDPTEALISIDVNSAHATGGTDIEETALNTNLEAAEEIARQLRIRDIGGLVVIDFIDMTQAKNQRAVSGKLKEALSCDRARVKVGPITRFGLLEMSRQRIRGDLDTPYLITCPRCEGRGSIRTIESLAASVVRMLEEVASQPEEANRKARRASNTASQNSQPEEQSNLAERDVEIQIMAPPTLASFLFNEYRDILVKLSQYLGIGIVVLPVSWMEMPHYELKKRRREATQPSYSLLAKIVENEPQPTADSGRQQSSLAASEQQQPLVQNELSNLVSHNGRSDRGSAEPSNASHLVGALWSKVAGLIKTTMSRVGSLMAEEGADSRQRNNTTGKTTKNRSSNRRNRNRDRDHERERDTTRRNVRNGGDGSSDSNNSNKPARNNRHGANNRSAGVINKIGEPNNGSANNVRSNPASRRERGAPSEIMSERADKRDRGPQEDGNSAPMSDTAITHPTPVVNAPAVATPKITKPSAASQREMFRTGVLGPVGPATPPASASTPSAAPQHSASTVTTASQESQE